VASKVSARKYKLQRAITDIRARLDELERLLDEEEGVARVTRSAAKKAKKKTARKAKKRKVRLSAKGRSETAKRRESKKRTSRSRDPRQIDIEDLLKGGRKAARAPGTRPRKAKSVRKSKPAKRTKTRGPAL
jgi:hypothetical protein